MVSFEKLESKPIGDIPHGASAVASWLAKVFIGGIGVRTRIRVWGGIVTKTELQRRKGEVEIKRNQERKLCVSWKSIRQTINDKGRWRDIAAELEARMALVNPGDFDDIGEGRA